MKRFPIYIFPLFLLIFQTASRPLLPAQDGTRAPVFHEPENLIIFPQFVVGSTEDFSFDVELRIANSNLEFPFAGQLGVFTENFETPPGLLVNGEPYDGPITVSLPPGESVLYEFELDSFFFQVQDVEVSTPPALFELFAELSSFEFTPLGNGAAGVSDLITSFFYNLRDVQGQIIDKIPAPPATAAKGFQFVLARDEGLNVGVAVVTSREATLDLTVRVPGDSPGMGTIFAGSIDVFSRDAFFLDEVMPTLPENIPAALAEVRIRGEGEVYGIVLSVQVDGNIVQLAGQPAVPIEPVMLSDSR